MSYWSVPTDHRPDEADDMPPELRGAFRRWARASAALRLYRRRGWNESAVLSAYNRERREVLRIVQELEDRERNPTLF